MAELIRIQKYCADCGVCSRRAAETAIAEGEIRVNG
ncbi:MAG: rRNA pseudouridine synthase, partial [Clostridia bacterium]|nr:rRNA pseudouridine synthase [Clostridia bacterium]